MEGGGGLGWDGWCLFLSGLDWLSSFSYSSRRELLELKHGSGTTQGGSFWVWSKDGTLLDLMMFCLLAFLHFLVLYLIFGTGLEGVDKTLQYGISINTKETHGQTKIDQITS